MSNVALKGLASGKFFVEGSGFTAENLSDATTYASSDEAGNIQGCLETAGLEDSDQVEATASYAVVYIRSTDEWDGERLYRSEPDANKGQFDPSKRRFATFAEAWQHGTRATQRKAKAGDKPGTAGHKGFFVVETGDPVNAQVNWLSGLTNSI